MRVAGTYLLGPSDQPDVDHLRVSTLVNAGRFVAEVDAVQWLESDLRSQVFGVYSHEGTLLSTLRAEFLSTPEELPPKLDYDHLHEVITLPCGLLGKAGTREEARGLGLSTYLQYLSYQEFHRRGFRYVAATLIPNAPHLKLLESLGFQFIENPEGWRRYGYCSFGRTLVAYLDLEANYDQVMTVLEPKVRELKTEYPFFGSLIARPQERLTSGHEHSIALAI